MIERNESDLGFQYEINKNGDLVIRHHGKFATRFCKTKADKIANQLHSMDFDNQQQLMARLTGNYKHGNERVAQQHLRNR